MDRGLFNKDFLPQLLDLAEDKVRNPSSSLLPSSLELSDTKVCEPKIRALLGTASHFCEVPHPPTLLNPKSQNPTGVPRS